MIEDESDFYSNYESNQEASEDDDYDVVMSDESSDSVFSEPPVLVAETYNDETMSTEHDEHESSFSSDSEMERLVELRSGKNLNFTFSGYHLE
ncbi:hypothetical protein GCK72_005852 [Caenorhabditis remanei]|uniref:Uncharacterized protein n=1 Tax=Caenorhabditis remanei TaxID=31234 RepID=A0A6A5HFC0_CAERE|nr:hypothetical protein GCK72_005852 [Caenorhabditis remanei]KAF1765899.1 hypothetical protein GCK72_005852 [Caenorhabditis remanei]